MSIKLLGSLLTLALLFSLSLQSIDLTIPAESLPYQAHSFNDLGIVRHILKKGIKYWKFDASMANKQACSLYSTSNTSLCYNSTKFVDELCCIAMRGDGSPQPGYYYPFNTSFQFVALFEQFLSQYHNETEMMLVAIDLQFPFEWENIVGQQFFLGLKRLMDKYDKLHVSVGGSYILEYDHVCRKLQQNIFTESNSQECTPKRRQISNGRFFLQSNAMNPYDSRDYKSRFKNFNIIYRQIDRLCRDGFPTWQNKYPNFPLIFWEPSNDFTIQDSLNKLLSPSCKAKHNRTIDGIAFATNLEPEMFLHSMRPLKNDHFPWSLDSEKIWLDGAKSVKIVKTCSQTDKLVIFWTQQLNNTKKNILSVLNLNETRKIVSLESSIELNFEVLEVQGTSDTIIIVGRSQGSAYFLKSYNLRLEQQNTYQIGDYLASFTNDQTLYYLLKTSNPNYVNLYYISSSLKKQTQYGVSIYMSKERIQAISSVFFQKGNCSDNDVFLITGSVGKQSWITQIKNSQEYKSKILTYGINPKFYLKEDGKVLIIVQNSYAHGGTLINQGGQNKCLYHKTPKIQVMASVKYLTNSLQGQLSDFVEFLEDPSNEIITGCHPKICFTRILNGQSTSTVFIWGRQLLATRYVHVTKQDFMGVIFSGGSNYEQGYRERTGFTLTSIRAKNQVKKQYRKKYIRHLKYLH